MMIKMQDDREDTTGQNRAIYFEPEAIKVIEIVDSKEDNKMIYYMQINNEYIFGYGTKEERDKELQKIFNAKGSEKCTTNTII